MVPVGYQNNRRYHCNLKIETDAPRGSLPALTSNFAPEVNRTLADISLELRAGEFELAALFQVDGHAVDLDILEVARQVAHFHCGSVFKLLICRSQSHYLNSLGVL